MKNIKKLLFPLLMSVAIFSACSKKDSTTTTSTTSTTGSTTGVQGTAYLFIIDNGAQVIDPKGSLTYKAHLVDITGTSSVPSSVSWSAAPSGIVDISSSGVVTVKGPGIVTVTASTNVGGATYIAVAPLAVSTPELFVVAPAGVLCNVGEQVSLTPVYTTNQTITYTYSVDNASIATVDASGMVTGAAAGSTFVTVTASNSNTVTVPVLVVGVPTVTIPVVRVEVSPDSKTAFRGDNLQFSAKAFKSDNTQNTSVSFTWATSDPNIATIDANGMLSAKNVGQVNILATSNGVTGSAAVQVQPDTALIITPISVSIPAGGTYSFTAKVYNVRNWTEITSHAAINWMIPSYGPGFEFFDIATVDASGKVTVKSSAQEHFSTILLAQVGTSPYAEGASLITVGPAMACGTGNSSVASISISNGDPINISLTSGTTTVQLNATAKDGSGNTVSSPDLHYNSDNTMVATVDATTGEITAVGPGSANITVCSGNYANKSIKVNVSF